MAISEVVDGLDRDDAPIIPAYRDLLEASAHCKLRSCARSDPKPVEGIAEGAPCLNRGLFIGPPAR